MAEIISLYESIARNIGDIYAKGIPSNGTPTTFDSTSLVSRNAQNIVGKEVFFYTGGGAGQARTIGSFSPTGTYRVYVEPPFDTAPSSNSKFLIFDKFRTEDYESAMNRGLGKAKLTYLQDKVGTLVIVGTQFEYPVPSGIEWISTIRLVPSLNTDYRAVDEVDTVFELPARYWRIERNVGGSYLIAFDARRINMSSFDGETAKVMGQAKADLSGTLLPEQIEEFVIAYASTILASQKIREGEQWKQAFYMFRDEANKLENYVFSYGHGKKVG